MHPCQCPAPCSARSLRSQPCRFKLQACRPSRATLGAVQPPSAPRQSDPLFAAEPHRAATSSGCSLIRWAQAELKAMRRRVWEAGWKSTVMTAGASSPSHAASSSSITWIGDGQTGEGRIGDSWVVNMIIA